MDSLDQLFFILISSSYSIELVFLPCVRILVPLLLPKDPPSPAALRKVGSYIPKKREYNSFEKGEKKKKKRKKKS
tara:strand:+ start:972 stop:1196 length:225 start_codon:yes stop_codon:yes gene_type:complete